MERRDNHRQEIKLLKVGNQLLRSSGGNKLDHTTSQTPDIFEDRDTCGTKDRLIAEIPFFKGKVRPKAPFPFLKLETEVFSRKAKF